MSNRTPAVFLGHGNPMHALASNSYTEAWRAFGVRTPRPSAILAISAHWYVPGCAVTVAAAPRTIHDFGGFPAELYAVEYPAPGAPALARQVAELLQPLPVALDDAWGLDHGTWAVLRHVYPEADVPVVQLSIDRTQPPQFHFDLGARLAPLRDQGVLLMGSGNLVHNLRAYDWHGQTPAAYDWAARFEAEVRQLLCQDRFEPLINYHSLGRDAQLSIPTPDHYLPLLYVLGARQPGESLTFPVEGFEGGSLSMLSISVGAA